MKSNRRNAWLILCLFASWTLVLAWQANEHIRVVATGRNVVHRNADAVANTLGAFIRGLQFRGTVFSDRLEPVLSELVNDDTNAPARPAELISVVLLNAAGEPVAAAGKPVDLSQKDILQQGERWGERTVTIVYPVFGTGPAPEGDTNHHPPVILTTPFTNSMRFYRRERRSEPSPATTNRIVEEDTNRSTPPEPSLREGESRPRRPFWARSMEESEYQSLIQKRELHGLVLTMSIESIQAMRRHDLWLRGIIVFFAGIAVLGAGAAWRNLSNNSDLQIRLVRASELNTHLKEMNLAAAGLAHETRNPLNIIHGLAQMIARQPDTPPALCEKARAIVDETDKVTAQLTEFINYSRPREVRRAAIFLSDTVNEVARTLAIDVEEKNLRLEVKGETFSVEADEQLLRQALFNLVLNAIQSVAPGGHIQIVTRRDGSAEASVEIRDDGPGVPAENRTEIFKPYFTTQPKGTGLGLAVVQQIVSSHGWEIQCLPNEPRGAVFRISHLQLAA